MNFFYRISNIPFIDLIFFDSPTIEGKQKEDIENISPSIGSDDKVMECQPVATKSVVLVNDVEVDVDGPVECNDNIRSNVTLPTPAITTFKTTVETKMYDTEPALSSRSIKSLSSLGVGTFSIDHEAVSRGISSGILNKKGKMQRCGNCKGCNATNCEKCVNCRNMVKYGGPGNLKQACIERRCVNPQVPMQESGQPIISLGKAFDGIEKITMSNLPTILPTTTAEMIKMDEVSTKYIKEALSTNVNIQAMDQPKSILGTPNLISEKVTVFEDVGTPIKNMNSNDVTLNDSEHTSPHKGFFKMLRRAEKYVADLDPNDTSRPKLSYGAMCALAIQVT